MAKSVYEMSDDEIMAINDVDSLSTEEVSRIAPMIKPIDLKNTIKKDKANLDIDVLVNLAVFLDEEEITEMAKRVDSISDISKLVGLAPFVNEKILYDFDNEIGGMIKDIKSRYRECGTFESGE